MNTKSFLTTTITMMIILGIFSFFGCLGKSESSIETFDYPPFTIEKKNTYSKRYDINTNSRRDNSRSYYKVYYRDQELTMPESLEENTGVSGLWKAYILNDATEPALVVGSQSVFLITEVGDQAKLTPLSEQNSGFASLQWLDSEDGQPGSKVQLYSSDDTGMECNLEGGQLLFINEKVVLDVKDLKIYPMRIRSEYTEGYYAGNVIALSPDKDNILIMGNRYDQKYNYALLQYNFRTNEAFTLPFDQTQTRLRDSYNIPAGWLNTYFEWKKEDEGSYIIVKKKLDQLPYWEGYISRDGGYTLDPVKAEMFDTLVAFTKEYLQLTNEEIRPDISGIKDTYEVHTSGYRLNIGYLDNIASVYFSAHFTEEDEEGAKEVIKDVGNAFNERLRMGKHQSLFTGF